MVTEVFNIQFRGQGAPSVKRSIDSIAESATRASRSINIFRNAMFALGGAGILRGLSRQLDTLTEFENRLRLTTNSMREAEAVQQQLFDTARNSRTEFESVAEIYTRTALSVKALGISTKETIQFTESLAKATIVSGASAREANAALVQLSQGLASNRLSGDELRSVLEQLPFVADVISRSLGVTRGELRKMGKEGKISAEVVLKAFREAREEIDEKFANTVATISQAFTVARTNWLQFLDSLDDASGVSAAVAQAIIIISQHLEELVTVLGLVAAAVVLTFTGRALAAVVNYGVSIAALGKKIFAIKAAEEARAGATLRRTTALHAANTAEVAAIRQGQVQLTQNAALIRQQQSEIVLDARRRTARSALTGQFIAYNTAVRTNIANNRALLLTEKALVASKGQLTAAQTAQTASLGRLTAATTGAAAASSGLFARFGALLVRIPLLGSALLFARGALAGLAGLAAANPLGAAIIGAVAATSAFLKWGNEIKVTSDRVVGLKDFVVAAFQLATEAIQSFVNFFSTAISPVIAAVQSEFADILETILAVFNQAGVIVKGTINFIVGVVVGGLSGIINSVGLLPAVFGSAGIQIANVFLAGFDLLVNGAIKGLNLIIAGLNALLSFIGAEQAADLFGFSGQIDTIAADFSSGRIQNEFEGAGSDLATAFGEGFEQGFNKDFVGAAADLAIAGIDFATEGIIDRARENIKLANEDLAFSQTVVPPTTPPATTGTGGGSGGGKGKNFATLISNLNKEAEALRLTNAQRNVQEGLLKLEKQLKRDLTAAEEDLAIAALRNVEISKEMGNVLEELRGPQDQAAVKFAALNQLLREGSISAAEFAAQMRDVAVSVSEVGNSFTGGIRNGLDRIAAQMNDLGSNVSNWVVESFGKATDAIVEFAKTGQINIRQLFQDIFASLLKLAANQLFSQLINGLLGGAGGFGAGAGLGGLLGLANGGTILPSGPGSTDSQVVAFKKRPDERVDVLTPAQQDAQRTGNGGQGGGTTVVTSPPPNIAVVVSPNDIASALGGSEGDVMIVRAVERNAKSIRSVLGA